MIPRPTSLIVGPPTVTYRGLSSRRAPAELLSLLQQHTATGDRILDAGCGDAEFRCLIDPGLGRHYVGIDLTNPAADLRADLHALPFSDGSFDAVLSYAVVAHLANPFQGVREIARVLKPGGVFIGTASFLEPFVHSYFHMTHEGVLAILRQAGLVPGRIWACRDGLAALATSISPYPRVIKWCLGGICRVARLPVLSPRRWLHDPMPTAERALRCAGSIGFVARKPFLESSSADS